MESPKAKIPRPRSRKSIAHMPSPETVNKENNIFDSTTSAEAAKASHKKSRSKSLGPGGLDALKETTGNRRDVLPAPFVKSILKPTIALSPPKQIPPHPNARQHPQSPRKQPPSPTKSPRKQSPEKQRSGSQEGILIDFSDGVNGITPSGPALPNPFSGSSLRRSGGVADLSSSSQSQSLIAVRTEEEQQDAARERERHEKDTARKDARRKSLANRRVSFAPDATLHTWEVLELPEDSTTSSASGNTTRRASGLSTIGATSPVSKPQSPLPGSDASEPPSTPPSQAEDTVKASPAPQRDLHQNKRRRSSGIPPMNFNNPEEFSSSPSSAGSVNSDDTGNQAFVTADEADSSDSDDKDLVEDESTVRVGDDDVTAQSALSARSSGGSSTASSGRLDEALRQAAKQAGTQGIDYDEHGGLTMEMADDEVTNAFQPWMKKGKYVPQVVGNPSALQDQENVNPFSPQFRSSMHDQQNDNEDGATMDFTQAAGSILPVHHKSQASPEKNRRRSSVKGTRRSIGHRRRSSGASSTYEDETMDLTTAIGGIEYDSAETKAKPSVGSEPQMSDEEDEELTMDFTTVLGGVLGNKAGQQPIAKPQTRRESIESSTMDEDMDITFAAGGILPSITERTEPLEDQTMEMDVTQAVGVILPKPMSMAEKARAKTVMEHETDVGQLSMDPFYDGPVKTTPGVNLNTNAAVFRASTTRTSEAGSPSKRDPSKSPALMIARQSITPRTGSRQTTPMKKVTTPSKQVTPQVGPRPTTPGKTPPSKNIAMRTGSPKKLFQKGTGNAVQSPKAANKNPIFKGNDINGVPTAQIVLKPRRRRSSGLGADKEGLGSPRVTELLDRRGSIHQSAQTFKSNGSAPTGVRFEDPRVMENELENERVEEERRQSGRVILQMEAESQDTGEPKDATMSLKDKIGSLTPQKKKPKPRKSLHVGAAKGILGKRPAELDVDEDEEGMSPQGVMGRPGSPVKKIKLPAPPSKNETTRRHLRSARLSLVETLGNNKMNTPSIGASPSKAALMTTPQGQARFKDVSGLSSAEKPMASFEEKLENGKPMATEPVEAEDRIHLQDFLNMTSIRFMELTTTKRRLTVAPTALESSARKVTTDHEQSSTEGALEKSVVAGACTVPMLELYQHSCRELKRYIAEGRSIVREIEGDTYEDNPALFREYMTASPDVKALMDNQFKNVKTHARLLSKAMWYEWRMKLLDGLKEGLVQIGNGMEEDAQVLSQQERHVEGLLPKLTEDHERLSSEHQVLQAQADELAGCDQDELRQAREQLAAIDEDLEAKQRLADELERELQAKEQKLQEAAERRDEYQAEIKEAERVRQESRGWKTSEVVALQ
ncbi:MAG: hypothetical protein Q9168_007816, partial [Polycauliona sp. 1 TL-2023]